MPQFVRSNNTGPSDHRHGQHSDQPHCIVKQPQSVDLWSVVELHRHGGQHFGDTGTPTGWVSFYNGATKLVTISVVSGSATYTTATLPTGSYSLTANYNGTTDFAASSSDPTTRSSRLSIRPARLPRSPQPQVT